MGILVYLPFKLHKQNPQFTSCQDFTCIKPHAQVFIKTPQQGLQFIRDEPKCSQQAPLLSFSQDYGAEGPISSSNLIQIILEIYMAWYNEEQTVV